MKCKNCGAEIDSNSTTCSYCGSSISYEMKKEQEQLNKKGCLKCGSSNITFNREKLGDVKKKKSTTIVTRTIGVCKDCGYTWIVSETKKKQTPIWLWIIGWILIFPLPLTILMMRRKNMNPKVKYGIIAAAWIIYILIILISRITRPAAGTAESTVPPETSATTVETTVATTTTTTTEETSAATEAPGVVDPEFKAVMDSYESFIDEYIKFMKKFEKHPTDTKYLSKYADMMAKYADWIEKIGKYDEDTMSDADLAYYLLVTARVEKKLVDAAIKT